MEQQAWWEVDGRVREGAGDGGRGLATGYAEGEEGGVGAEEGGVGAEVGVDVEGGDDL
jgi:hypothetical protein